MKISYLYHNGQKIMCIDYSGCQTTKDTVDLLNLVHLEYQKSNETFRTVSIFTNVFGSSEFMKRARELGPDFFDPRTEKAAVLGVTGMKKILLDGYNMFVKHKLVPFETMEEALDYLAK